jgi:hypothetical protein
MKEYLINHSLVNENPFLWRGYLSRFYRNTLSVIDNFKVRIYEIYNLPKFEYLKLRHHPALTSFAALV